MLFFFSSRRRHTRYWRDWSSDVCSSDLPFEPRKGRVHLWKVLHPLRKRAHYLSSPDVYAPDQGVHYTDRFRDRENGGAMERLEGKRAVVTGAGAGIGRAIALRLAGEGARVALADVDEEAVEKVASEIAGETLARRTDVTREEEVEALISNVVEAWGGLDVMV